MDAQEDLNEKTESKKSPTAWLVKCSQEQKELLQKRAAESGKSVAQFLVDAVQTSSIKEALTGANNETQKEFSEIDGLLERLNHLIYAKVYTLIEKEKNADELKVSLTRKENECEKDYQDLKDKLEKEYSEKKDILKNEVEQILIEERQKNNVIFVQKEQECLSLQEKNEQLEAKVKKLERDNEIAQKQITESKHSYEIADERLMELRSKIKDQEEKLRTFNSTIEKNNLLERELTILQVKFDGLKNEEAIKREYLEKDLRREFDMKLIHLNQGGH